MLNENRIKEWRSSRGWSLQHLADLVETSRAQIDKLERGERRLTVDWMIRLAKALECLPADLLPLQRSPPLPHPMIAALPPKTIPVRSAARGGHEQEMFLADGPLEHRPCPPYAVHMQDIYAIIVVGESMHPMYRAGQILYVNPHKPCATGRGVVVSKTNHAVLIKEFLRASAEGLWVREYQPTQRDFLIPHVEITTAHPVIGAEEPH